MRPDWYDSEGRHRGWSGSAESNMAGPVFRCANDLSAFIEFKFYVATAAGTGDNRVQELGALIAAKPGCPIAPETADPFAPRGDTLLSVEDFGACKV